MGRSERWRPSLQVTSRSLRLSGCRVAGGRAAGGWLSGRRATQLSPGTIIGEFWLPGGRAAGDEGDGRGLGFAVDRRADAAFSRDDIGEFWLPGGRAAGDAGMARGSGVRCGPKVGWRRAESLDGTSRVA